MSKYIQLTKGQQTLVDDEDFEYLNQWRWHTSYYGYANRRRHIKSSRKDQKFEMIKMHRLIMGAPTGMYVDHINGDKLDNRKSNLRVCTNAQNSANQQLRAANTSGYKGVTLDKRRGKWIAQIRINYKNNFLGYFDDKIEAAQAYNRKAKEVWGEYAKINEC